MTRLFLDIDECDVMTYVFVYGTLKRGFWNHGYLADCEFIGTGHLVDKYPMIVDKSSAIPFLLNCKGSGHQVEGEIYKVSKETLSNLDRLEGYPGWYNRTDLPIHITSDPNRGQPYTINCLVYILDYHEDEIRNSKFYSNYDHSHLTEKS